MAQIGSLSVKLGLVTVEWDKATAKAKAQAKDLHDSFNKLGGGLKTLSEHFRNFGTLGGTLGFAALYQGAVKLTDEVDDLSKSFGLSVPQILAFRNALQNSGGQADSAAKVLSTLFSKIDDARSGNDSAIAQFEKLGITFSDLKAMSPYEAIIKVADGFQSISNQFQKTKAIKEFFGKAGIGLSIQDVSDALKQGSSQFDKYAKSIKTVGQVSDAIKQNLNNLQIAFAQVVAPFTTSAVVSIERFEAILRGIGSAALVLGIGAVAIQLVAVGTAIRAITIAGGAFNLMAGGATPIGIILKAVAAGTAIGAYLIMSEPSGDSKGTENKSKGGGGRGDWGAGGSPKAKTREEIVTAAIEEVNKTVDQPFSPSTGNIPTLDDKTGSKESTAKNVAIQLSKSLMAIDAARAKINLDIENKDALSNEIALIKLSTQEKTLQIASKLAQELEAMNEDGSEQLKNSTKALAAQEKSRVIAQGAAEEAFAKEKSRLDFKKQAFDQEVEYLKLLGDIGADNDQTTIAQRNAEQAARDAAAFGFTVQIKDSERLTKLANARLAYEATLANYLPAKQNALMAEYDAEVKVAEFRRQAMALGVPAEQTERIAKAMQDASAQAGAVANAIAKIQLGDQVTEATRLSLIAKQRLEYEQTLILKLPETRAALLANYDLEQKISEFSQQAFDLGIPSDRIDMYANQLRAAGKATAQVTADTVIAQRTFNYGWQTAFIAYEEAATNAANRGAASFQAVAGAMDSAIDDFVKNGKSSFEDFSRNVIQSLIAIEMKAQAIKLLRFGIEKAVSFFGGFFADGGEPPVGRVSVVGENGPELFVPKEAGTILPNSYLPKSNGASVPSGAMQQQSNAPTINYNGPYIASMSAIDTQSGLQFLAKNKQSVWSAYQSANRSIPMSR